MHLLATYIQFTTAFALVAVNMAQGGGLVPDSSWLEYGELGALCLVVVLWTVERRLERRDRERREDARDQWMRETLERSIKAIEEASGQYKELRGEVRRAIYKEGGQR